MRLSPSVKITYFDKEGVWAATRDFAAELARAHPEVEEVVVFGSLVRGEAVPGSDVDLLVILRDSNVPFLDRMTSYMPDRFPVGMDVFPYTKAEIEQMLQDNNFFIKRALGEGVELFSRQ
ncbi:MAG: nucleotidyltransferase domain-containing protein [Chloroflexi bacterium]|nr:nucleotidyltransferase domain-containing protein [Chloroflexota bacterium]